MNKTNKFASYGQWIFAFLIIGILVIIYAAQDRQVILLLICAILIITLSLSLLLLLLKADKILGKAQQEVLHLKQRESARLHVEQQSTAKENSKKQSQTDNLQTNEILARIIPASEAYFDNIKVFAEMVLQNIAKELNIVQGLVFVLDKADQMFHSTGEYAFYSEEPLHSFPLGDTLPGQVAKNQQLLNLNELPEGYITILSGLGKSNPQHLIIVPIISNGESIGVMELASFKPFNENDESLIRKISELMANQLNELRS